MNECPRCGLAADVLEELDTLSFTSTAMHVVRLRTLICHRCEIVVEYDPCGCTTTFELGETG